MEWIMLNNTDTIECVLHSLRYSSDLFITHAYVFMKSLHLQMVRSCVESAIVKQRFTMNQDCTEGATGRVNEIDGHTFVDTKIHFALQLLCSKSLPKFTFLLFFFLLRLWLGCLFSRFFFLFWSAWWILWCKLVGFQRTDYDLLLFWKLLTMYSA